MMKLAIGGELVKWNATRFGTNYMFLQSFMRKKDQFMQWMMTPEFRASRHFNSEQERYAYANLTNLDWWANMQYVLEDVEPLYVFLRFADQDQVPTLGEVVVQYQNTKQTYAANLI
jgi:DNA modification methylase